MAMSKMAPTTECARGVARSLAILFGGASHCALPRVVCLSAARWTCVCATPTAETSTLSYPVREQSLIASRRVAHSAFVDRLSAACAALTQLVRGGVGIPTCVATARFVASLASTQPSLVAPYAQKLLAVCLPRLEDRSITVRKAYAHLLAVVGKVRVGTSW